MVIGTNRVPADKMCNLAAGRVHERTMPHCRSVSELPTFRFHPSCNWGSRNSYRLGVRRALSPPFRRYKLLVFQAFGDSEYAVPCLWQLRAFKARTSRSRLMPCVFTACVLANVLCLSGDQSLPISHRLPRLVERSGIAPPLVPVYKQIRRSYIA